MVSKKQSSVIGSGGYKGVQLSKANKRLLRFNYIPRTTHDAVNQALVGVVFICVACLLMAFGYTALHKLSIANFFLFILWASGGLLYLLSASYRRLSLEVFFRFFKPFGACCPPKWLLPLTRSAHTIGLLLILLMVSVGLVFLDVRF